MGGVLEQAHSSVHRDGFQRLERAVCQEDPRGDAQRFRAEDRLLPVGLLHSMSVGGNSGYLRALRADLPLRGPARGARVVPGVALRLVDPLPSVSRSGPVAHDARGSSQPRRNRRGGQAPVASSPKRRAEAFAFRCPRDPLEPVPAAHGAGAHIRKILLLVRPYLATHFTAPSRIERVGSSLTIQNLSTRAQLPRCTTAPDLLPRTLPPTRVGE